METQKSTKRMKKVIYLIFEEVNMKKEITNIVHKDQMICGTTHKTLQSKTSKETKTKSIK